MRGWFCGRSGILYWESVLNSNDEVSTGWCCFILAGTTVEPVCLDSGFSSSETFFPTK